jgi:hypothetical protein
MFNAIFRTYVLVFTEYYVTVNLMNVAVESWFSSAGILLDYWHIVDFFNHVMTYAVPSYMI